MFYAASKVLWFFATPSNALPALALTGLLLLMRRSPVRSFGYGLAIASLVLLLAAGLSPLASWVIRPLDERFPPLRDNGGAVTGIIVLGGATQAAESFSNGQLTINEAGERLLALADLARRYPSARLIYSGGTGDLLTEDRPESEAVLAFSDTLGIPRERLEIETESRTTSENAVFTRRLVEPKPGERWLLVTSSWHMPRAVGCFRKVGFAVVPYPVDFRTSWPQDATRFFPVVADGLKRLDIAAKEWAGLVAYRLAGHIDSVFPGP